MEARRAARENVADNKPSPTLIHYTSNESWTAPRLPPDPPEPEPQLPANHGRRKITMLEFGQAAKDTERAKHKAQEQMSHWLSYERPVPLDGFRRVQGNLVRPIDDWIRDPLMQWPVAVKGRPLLPAGTYQPAPGYEVLCFRPGPPGVIANIPERLGGTVRFPPKPKSPPPKPPIGEAVLKRQRAKEKSRSRRLWRRLCGCRQPEPEPVEEVVEEARVEVAKLRSQMNEQLSMILDQQAVRPPRPAVCLSLLLLLVLVHAKPQRFLDDMLTVFVAARP